MVEIGITEDVLQRLEARQREGESINDVIDRLLSEVEPHWREGFGMVSERDREQFRKSVNVQRHALNESLSRRQEATLKQIKETDR